MNCAITRSGPALDKYRRSDVFVNENHSQSQDMRSQRVISRTQSFIATTAIITLTLLAALNPSTARAADDSSLRFQAGNVEPASLTLPANTPVKLHVTN